MNRVIAVGLPFAAVLVLFGGPLAVVSVAVPVLVVVTIVHLVNAHDAPRTSDSGRLRATSLVAPIVRVTVCAVIVICGFRLATAAHPVLALLLVTVLAASCPPAREKIRQWCRSPEAAVDHPRPSGLRHLSDRELSRAWEHTSLTLERTQDQARILGLLTTRQHLLDEIWTRDRASLERWVSHGARAHDGTHRFFDP